LPRRLPPDDFLPRRLPPDDFLPERFLPERFDGLAAAVSLGADDPRAGSPSGFL